MGLEHAVKLAQRCIQENPVLVLGSGSSVPHGLGSMSGLAADLVANIQCDNSLESDSWLIVRDALNKGCGLEEALHETDSPQSLVTKIVRTTWQYIANADLDLFLRVAAGNEKFPLSDLLIFLMRSTHKSIDVVTTNYDRVCEYAVDMAKLVHSTGFIPGHIQRREGQQKIQILQGNQPVRTVRIWKVHGSLDWFADGYGNIKSLPKLNVLHDEFDPLIVTPGVSKFQRTYDEPFRSTIQGADVSLEQANAFMCIGYGFRDAHIQPKLMERANDADVPVVVLAKELTSETRGFLRNSAGRSYVAFEGHSGGTMAYTYDRPDGYLIQGKELWSLSAFNELAL